MLYNIYDSVDFKIFLLLLHLNSKISDALDTKHQHIKFVDFSRRYLTLDKYMSGRFMPLFLWTLVISLLIFAALYLAVWISGQLSDSGFNTVWTPGEAFIQLSNPSRHLDELSSWEWIPIVAFNLFGLLVINGVVLTLLVNWISNRKDRHDKGEARYDYIFTRNHSVIIGGHKIVSSLARDLMNNGVNEYILVQTQRNPEKVRKEIEAEITDESVAHRVIIYSGDRSSLHELKELHLDTAKEVYIIGEPSSIDGSSHDAINMETWKLINELYPEIKAERIRCHVMFEYQSTFTAFQFTDLKLEDSPSFRFIPFSIYENWAQQVLISEKEDGVPFYIPLDGIDGLPYSSPQRAHLIVIGMSRMGMALAMEAAHIAHYPNFNNKEVGRPRTLITFIDRDANREMLRFMGKFKELFKLARWRMIKAPQEIIMSNTEEWDIYDSIPNMSKRLAGDQYRWHDPMKDEDFKSPYFGGYLGEDLIDIDFEFIEGDVSLPSIQKYISDACSDCSSNADKIGNAATSKTTIAVCFPVAVESMSTALYFDPSVYENAQQIWVQQAESGALVDAIRYGLTGEENAKFHTLRPFGMLGQCDYLVRINSILPKIVAYAYNCLDAHTSLDKEYHKKNKGFDKLIDDIEKGWLVITHDGGKSAISKRRSNIYCANSFETKIRSTGISVASSEIITDKTVVEQLAKTEHNRWVIEQLLLGVRPVDKEYADMLPIEDRALRGSLKSRNIHPDMISNEKLGSSQAYDEAITKIIPLALTIAEMASIKSQNESKDEK